MVTGTGNDLWRPEAGKGDEMDALFVFLAVMGGGSDAWGWQETIQAGLDRGTASTLRDEKRE